MNLKDEQSETETELIKSEDSKITGSVLVVGGGIGGIQAALDLADSGYYVYMVEQAPAIGGVMPQLDKTFPTNDCSMCILSPKLVECGRHLNIEVLTCSELDSIEGTPGNYTAKIKRLPRYVDTDKCTGCGLCGKVDIPNKEELVEHNGELWVSRIIIDEDKCIQCGDCARACEKENSGKAAMGTVCDKLLQMPAGAETVDKSTSEKVKQIMGMDEAKRKDFWQTQFNKCMKCYGCRDVCPVFIEEECRLEDWSTPGLLPPDPQFHLARALYISEHCTHCGYCEDACPADIPLRALVNLIRHDDPQMLFSYVPLLTEDQNNKISAAFTVGSKEEV